jgi:hypothetical protein
MIEFAVHSTIKTTNNFERLADSEALDGDEDAEDKLLEVYNFVYK